MSKTYRIYPYAPMCVEEKFWSLGILKIVENNMETFSPRQTTRGTTTTTTTTTKHVVDADEQGQGKHSSTIVSPSLSSLH